ncbi:MAG TPA: 50S ribosomal protein L9 [Armatimonadota bacterium]|nr:50S ribosomal protein L9 [Armatimonadota bacterium]
MKVILKQEVKNLGREWDLVTVADGYARNFLLPRNMAMPATQASMKDLERRRERASVHRQHEEDAARSVAGRLEGMTVTVTARCGPEGKLYGSITASDIAEYLEQHGVPVDRRRVELAEPIRTIGAHHVNIQLHSNVVVRLRVQVEPEGGMPVQAPAPAVEPAVTDEAAENEESVDAGVETPAENISPDEA